MIAVYHQCIQYHLVRSKTVGYIINRKKTYVFLLSFHAHEHQSGVSKVAPKKPGLFKHRMKPDTGVSILRLSHDLIEQQILRVLEKLNT